MSFRAGLATLALGASLASAISISQSCQNALQGLATGPAGACLNANGILNIAIQNPNTTIVQPLNTFLTGFCAATPCSNSTLASVVSNITTGCSSDIAQFGVQLPDTATLTAMVQQYYPTVVDAGCLKLTNNTFCAAQLVNNIQGITGTLSADNIIQKIPTLIGDAASLPSGIVCSDCTKEMYNVIVHQQPSLNSTIAGVVSGECGSSFTDGASPTGIFEATGTVTSTAKSAGVVLPISRSVVLGLAVSGLTAVFSGFLVLA